MFLLLLSMLLTFFTSVEDMNNWKKKGEKQGRLAGTAQALTCVSS